MSADLATVDRQRRDLVASVSHELRTPLAALVAWDVNRWDGLNLFFGGVQAVERTAGGTFAAAGDPRRGGTGIVVVG